MIGLLGSGSWATAIVKLNPKYAKALPNTDTTTAILVK